MGALGVLERVLLRTESAFQGSVGRRYGSLFSGGSKNCLDRSLHICFNLPFYRRGHQSPKNLYNGSKVAHPVSARTTGLEASLLACKGLGVVVCPARTVLNIQHLLCMCLCSQRFPSDTSPGPPRPYCPCCKSSCDSSCRRLCSGPAHRHQ